MMFGLPRDVVHRLQEVFVVHPKVEKAILYGSRAKGNYRNGSDIDLTFEGNIDSDDIYSISRQIDDLKLPYLFDLSAFDEISNPDLVDYILRVGKAFYQKESGVIVGWTNLKLGEIMRLEYGKPLPKERRVDNGAFPVYGANGIKCRANDVYWEKPSIVVGRKGSAGELNLVSGKFWPLDVSYFVVFDESKYDITFLYYLLSRIDLLSLAKGVKPGLNRNDVYGIEQYLPSLRKQKRIATTLNKAAASTADLSRIGKQKLKHLAELKQSLLHQAFTGELTAHSKASDRSLSEASV